MKFLDWAPMVTISALTGQRVTNILPLVVRANEARNFRVPTSQLNKFFEDSILQPRGGSAPAPVKIDLRLSQVCQAGRQPYLGGIIQEDADG